MPQGQTKGPHPLASLHARRLSCCSSNATSQKETAQRPWKLFATPFHGDSNKKPRHDWGTSSLQGLRNARLPRVPKPLLWVGLTSNQFPVGRCFLRLPVAFALQHAGRKRGTLDTASEALTLGGSHACPTCLRNHHFDCTRTWRLLLAPPAGGSNATTEVSENLLSIFARFPGRGPPSTGALLCLMRRPTRSSLKFRHLGVPVRPQLSQPTPAKF